ncbi:MAG: NUDIX hydrolase [Bacteroidota bacterium]|nr:NUDIX hydrolase [Bacteroidota bacterium]
MDKEKLNEEQLLENPWKTLSSEPVFDSPWINVTKHEVINPAGNPGNYSVVHFKNTAIGILPLDENLNTWIVGQFRYPLKKYSWEIPEGGGKLDVPALDSAKRELLEETGIVANKWTPILEMHLSNSVSDEHAMIFIAQNLSFKEAQPEETEELQVKKIHFNELFNMVMDGQITDSMSVAAVLKTKILIDQGEL